MIITGLLIVSALILVAILSVLLLIVYRACAVWRVITQFVTPEVGKMSPVGELTESLIIRLSKQLAMQLKTTLMGVSSALSRQEAGVQADMMGDALQSQNPLFGALDLFPTLKRRVAKNPALAQLALGMLSKIKPVKPPGGNGPEQLNRFGGE